MALSGLLFFTHHIFLCIQGQNIHMQCHPLESETPCTDHKKTLDLVLQLQYYHVIWQYGMYTWTRRLKFIYLFLIQSSTIGKQSN